MFLRPVLRPVLAPVLGLPTQSEFVGLDPAAAAWAAAVTAAGGTYSASTLLAQSRLAAGLKEDGVWPKINRLNTFCGNQLAAALVPLKVGAGNPTDTNMNFVGGDYTQATGLTGDNTTKYLKTGLLANTLTLNDTHLAVYNRAAVASPGVPAQIGCDDGANRFQIAAPFINEVVYSDQYNSSAAAGRVNTAAAIAAPYGFIAGSRTGPAAHAIYRNGAPVVSNATAGGVLPALEIYVCATNVSGAASGFIRDPLGAYSIGSGLTAGEMAAFNNRLEAFQDALGRGVQ